MEEDYGEAMMLVKIDESLYMNPQYVAFVAKQNKVGSPLDHDPSLPNENIVKMMTGDIFIVKQEIDLLCEKLGIKEEI
jgi:hypothetical protein